MAGPVVVDRDRKPPRTFKRETAEDTDVLLSLMGVLHSEPLSSAFSRVLRNDVKSIDVLPLAHFFEEIAVLIERGHLAEDLAFDTFALDLYWDQLQSQIKSARKASHNPKLCENFEAEAEVAREYRESQPARGKEN
jgi:hypothetical protein